MRRRDLLVVLASGVPGCTGPSGGLSTRAATRTRSTTPTPRTTLDQTTDEPEETTSVSKSPFPRRLAVETVDDGELRETFGVGAEISVPDAELTAGDTAVVELGLHSVTGAKRTLTYEQRHCGRNEFRATTDGFDLFLFPAAGEWINEGIACPVVSGPNLACGIPVVEETVTVPATDRLAWRYDVLVPPGNIERGRCVVPGHYRFTRSFTRTSARATLSFTLSVSDP